MTTKAALILTTALGLLNAGAWADGSLGAKDDGVSTTTAATNITDSDKILYSLGYELGTDLKRQELELKPEPLLKGVDDALSGAKPVVKVGERRAALKAIKQQRAEASLEASLAFLAANAQKDGVTTLPSGLQYKELKAGDGRRPGPTDKVRVNYRGSLMDGTEFDSSYARGKPATFSVNRVIKGWREALQLMQEGAKWELYIPPELAYGERGRPGSIPPNSLLTFEVELVKVL